MTFSAEAYKNLSTRKSKLTTTAQDLFYVMNYEFAKTHNLKTVQPYLVFDWLEDLQSETTGFFQLYFYTNLFLTLAES